MMKFLNRAASISIYLINLYYIPFSLVNAWGCLHGAVAQPIFSISLIANGLVVPATFALIRKHQISWVLLSVNAIGLIYSAFWLALLLSAPNLD